MPPLAHITQPIPLLTDILDRATSALALTLHISQNAAHSSLALNALRRDDSAATATNHIGNNHIASSSTTSSGGSNTQAPALSPSAIVGISIVGALFFCVASAAMLRYFQRGPDPSLEPNSTDLYRPESASQLEHMKRVRDFNRAAAWERAEEARTVSQQEEDEGEREGHKSKVMMMQRVLGVEAGQEKMRRGNVRRGPWMGMGKGVKREAQQDEREEWRKRMGMSTMEAGGMVAMDDGEVWPLVDPHSRELRVAGQGRKETLLGGPRDYSDGAYADTSSESGGQRIIDSKGKRPETRRGDGGRGVVYPAPASDHPEQQHTSPPVFDTPQPQSGARPQLQSQPTQELPTVTVSKVPDYYD